MKAFTHPTRSLKVILLVVLALAVATIVLPRTEFYREWKFEGKSKSREGGVLAEVINSSPENRVSLAPPAPTGFTPQVQLGFLDGDEWEPAIAADRSGHVYMIYPQYGGVPGCESCYSPTMIYQMSNDHGQTWSSPPRVIYPEGSTSYQVDAQVVVDPADGKTVYVSWLQNNKSDIIVGKSTDFGAHWSFVLANHTNAATDKPILAVRGQDVYVSYNHAQTAFVTYSHDGGTTFTEVKMNQNGKLGWSLGGGGTVTPNDNVYFAWDGYEGNGGANGNVNLYISKSTDGGATWTTKLLDISTSPPDCSEFSCGWAYLGAAIAMTSDSSGNLYALWNAGSEPRGPERIYFSKSTNGGNTWSAKQDVSTARQGIHHNFPAIAAAGNGDVRIAWMDARAANGDINRWNVYFRSSTNGGSSWTPEVDVSTYVSGFSYLFPDGFGFPYGDYFEIDVDEQGTNHLVFGEGPDYAGPGSIWYTKGK
jgi:BNR repeat-like domain